MNSFKKFQNKKITSVEAASIQGAMNSGCIGGNMGPFCIDMALSWHQAGCFEGSPNYDDCMEAACDLAIADCTIQ